MATDEIDYVLRIYDTETDETSELLTFESDREAEDYWHSVSEAYPDNFDFEVIWKDKAEARKLAPVDFWNPLSPLVPVEG